MYTHTYTCDTTDVPPQPNSLHDYVFSTDQPSNGTFLYLVVVQVSVQRKSRSTGSLFPADYPNGRSLGSGSAK